MPMFWAAGLVVGTSLIDFFLPCVLWCSMWCGVEVEFLLAIVGRRLVLGISGISISPLSCLKL
jgi:hypothetical protein